MKADEAFPISSICLDRKEVECGICYSFEIEKNEVPEVACPNAQCNKIFHYLCFRDWFQNEYQTHCVYCETEISIQDYMQ